MLGKNVGLVLPFFFYYIAFSEQGGTCTFESLKRIPSPQIVKYQMSSVNTSLDIKTCGPPGSPDIIYKVKPEKITAKTRFIDIEISAKILANVTDGGFVDATLLLGQDNQPIRFFSAYDCEMLDGTFKCPLPLTTKDWLYLKAVCDTRFYLPNVSGKINIKIQNYKYEEAICIEGQVRTF